MVDIDLSVNDLNRLAARTGKLNKPASILATIAEKLEIDWDGKTPKQIRASIVKAIHPDRNNPDEKMKKAREAVLVQVNRAYDMAKRIGKEKQVLRKKETSRSSFAEQARPFSGGYRAQSPQPEEKGHFHRPRQEQSPRHMTAEELDAILKTMRAKAKDYYFNNNNINYNKRDRFFDDLKMYENKINKK
jgi:hypothetical protein